MKKILSTLFTAVILLSVCISAQARSFSIGNISHKITESEGEEGIEFKMSVKVFDNRGRSMQVFGFIQYLNAQGEWKYVPGDPGNSFVNNRGQVYAQSRFLRCARKKASRKAVKVFVPSHLLPRDPDVKYYRVRFRVCDRFNNNFDYKDSSEIPYYYFEIGRQEQQE